MLKTPAAWPLATLSGIALLSAAYMGAYYALLSNEPRGMSFSAGGPFMPNYRTEGVRGFLEPAHELDLRLRSDYWKFNESNRWMPR